MPTKATVTLLIILAVGNMSVGIAIGYSIHKKLTEINLIKAKLAHYDPQTGQLIMKPAQNKNHD